MQHDCRFRIRPPSGGYITLSTLILASGSALMLVLLSGCHSTPANAFASTSADRAAEARLRPVETMAPLQPFDEGFVAAPVEGAAQP